MTKRSAASTGIKKVKSSVQVAKSKFGHIEKFSGDAYKSAKGHGDVLKAGKLEPFSYIQLNPRMLNKRHKDSAVKSFNKIVDFGKKTDKRKSGALKGLAVTKRK